jgi:hypothetical protein
VFAMRGSVAHGGHFLSRSKTSSTIHSKLQAFLQLLEFRIVGSALIPATLPMAGMPTICVWEREGER